jgi:hypothetical protein
MAMMAMAMAMAMTMTMTMTMAMTMTMTRKVDASVHYTSAPTLAKDTATATGN